MLLFPKIHSYGVGHHYWAVSQYFSSTTKLELNDAYIFNEMIKSISSEFQSIMATLLKPEDYCIECHLIPLLTCKLKTIARDQHILLKQPVLLI